MKLTRGQQREVRAWLKLPGLKQEARCPFVEEIIAHTYASVCKPPSPCQELCPAIFPRLAKKRAAMVGISFQPLRCPCYYYPRSYVVRVARILLARKGVTNERKTK
jgi:hypothetical protein